ncbi:hypothetical protein GCM10009794_14490 [Rothia terrae]
MCHFSGEKWYIAPLSQEETVGFLAEDFYFLAHSGSPPASLCPAALLVWHAFLGGNALALFGF